MDSYEIDKNQKCNIFQNFINLTKKIDLEAKETCKKPWIVDAITNESLTLNTALKEITRLRTFLMEQNIQQGDAVAMIMENNVNYYIAVLACWSLGAVVCPMDVKGSKEDLMYMNKELKPVAIIYLASRCIDEVTFHL